MEEGEDLGVTGRGGYNKKYLVPKKKKEIEFLHQSVGRAWCQKKVGLGKHSFSPSTWAGICNIQDGLTASPCIVIVYLTRTDLIYILGKLL